LNGRVSPTNYEQRQPHDYIDLPSLSKQGISEKVAAFYASGMSLSQISRELNRSKNYIRKTLMDAGVELRASCRFPDRKQKEPKKYHTGVAPFGYRILHGQLILDAREIQIVQLVMNLWTSGKSYCAMTFPPQTSPVAI
jgi:hypothetical protein